VWQNCTTVTILQRIEPVAGTAFGNQLIGFFAFG
jgi:hypothetical protein